MVAGLYKNKAYVSWCRESDNKVDANLATQLSVPASDVNPPKLNKTSFVTIRVGEGDTLYKYCRKYNTSVEAIKALNPSIRNPDLIYVGQIIQIRPNSNNDI